MRRAFNSLSDVRVEVEEEEEKAKVSGHTNRAEQGGKGREGKAREGHREGEQPSFFSCSPSSPLLVPFVLFLPSPPSPVCLVSRRVLPPLRRFSSVRLPRLPLPSLRSRRAPGGVPEEVR
jgi:hypothetical protein